VGHAPAEVERRQVGEFAERAGEGRGKRVVEPVGVEVADKVAERLGEDLEAKVEGARLLRRNALQG